MDDDIERMREIAKRAVHRLPMGVEEAERRRLEKISLFPLRYGVGPERLKDILSSTPPMSRWQRFRQFCRDLASSLTGD